MSDNFHPAMKFVIAIDKPVSVAGSYNEVLPDDTQLLIVAKDGTKSTMLLRDLIPLINKHNLCVTSQVFEGCEGIDVPLYSVQEDGTVDTQFEPQENCAWGFDEPSIAWYKNNNDMTALVLVPGYRLHAVKEDKSGIFVEDTQRDRIFVEYGTFNPALLFETKKEYLNYNRQRKLVEEYRFNDWDYMLVATADHNYKTDGQLLKICYPDFKALLERYEANGLDEETCLDEGNLKISTPWVAFFKKPTKRGLLVVKAYLGAPGYAIESIVPKSENVRPGINIVDANGEKVWLPWAGWHDCFKYPNYTAFKEAKERGEVKFTKKRPYANVGKSKYQRPMVTADIKPNMASILWDVKNAKDLPDDQIMESLGVTPLR